MERIDSLDYSKFMMRDVDAITALALEMKSGDLKALQILRKNLTGSNKDNKNIRQIPDREIELDLDKVGTLLIASNIFHALDELLSNSRSRVPVSSLETLKSLSSSLGSYLVCSLSHEGSEQIQRSLSDTAINFFKLKYEVENLEPSPKSWIEL